MSRKNDQFTNDCEANQSVMTPRHPKWDEFADKLAHSDEDCRGALRATKAALLSIEGINIPASLGYLAHRGGHCDCEVFMNVTDDEAGNADALAAKVPAA
jgi:hypothetical protein